jgi:hypothetical protein
MDIYLNTYGYNRPKHRVDGEGEEKEQTYCYIGYEGDDAIYMRRNVGTKFANTASYPNLEPDTKDFIKIEVKDGFLWIVYTYVYDDGHEEPSVLAINTNDIAYIEEVKYGDTVDLT